MIDPNIDINFLGNFESIEDVWVAFPNGGQEGDYLYIGDVLYRWDKYDLSWGTQGATETLTKESQVFLGEVDIHDDLHVGGEAVFNGAVRVKGFLHATAVKQPNMGLFPSLQALQAAYPKPEVGMWATVGNTIPSPIYRCDVAGVWTATGEVGGIDPVDLTDHEKRIEATEKALAEGGLFGGVATPDTKPEKLSQKMVYLAETFGSYPNMGNIFLEEGEVAFIIWDGYKWSKEPLDLAKREDLNKKYGYARKVDNVHQFFANEQHASLYDEDPESNGDLLLYELSAVAAGEGGGGSSAGGYTVRLVNNMSGRTFYASKGSPVNLQFTFTSVQSIDDSEEATGERGVLQVLAKKPTDVTFVPVREMYIPSGEMQVLEVSQYLGTGANQIQLKCVGEISGETTPSLVYTVQVTALSVSAPNFNWATPYVKGIVVPFYIGGNVSKILHVAVKGQDYDEVYSEPLGVAVYNETPYNFTIPHPQKGGVFTLEAYVTNADESIRIDMNPVQFICVLEDDGGKYMAVNNISEKAVNWTETTIFNYSIYDRGSNVTNVEFTVAKGDEVISTLVLDSVPTGTKQTLVAPLEVETLDDTPFSIIVDAGDLIEQVEIPVDNSFSYAPTAGAVFQFSPKRRDNSESNRAVIINDITGEEVPTELTNMNWSNDGWQSAEDGKVLRLQAGSKLTIGVQPLADMTQYSKGKTIELDFRCENVLKYDTPIVTIQDAVENNKASLNVYPDMAVLTSQLKYTANEQENQSTKFEDGVRLRMTIVILPTAYGNQGFNLAKIYINNNCVREFTFSNADKFLSTGNLILGSEDADLDIYGIRIYNSSLSRGAVETNFKNYLATLAEKQAAALRNDLFNAEGTSIDIDKVKQFCNVVVYERAAGNTLADIIPSITNQNESLLDVHFFFRDTPEENLVIRNFPVSGQGTSSMKYRFWNLRGKPTDKTIIEYADGSTSVKSFRWLGLEGIERLTDKINFASSPQSNKMGSVNSIVALTNYMGITADDNTPLAIIQRPFARFSLDTNEEGQKVYTFLGLGTIGPDKGDDGYMGVDEETKPNQLSLEGSDNAPLPTQFRVPWVAPYFRYNADEEAWQYKKNATEWENCWDANEGDPNNTSAMADFINFYNFIYSCSPRLTYFDGTADALNAQVATLKNVDTEFWLAGGDVYYYCPAEGKFIPSNCGSGTINLYAQLVDKGYGITSQDVEGKSNEELTALFVKARCTKFGYEIGQYCNARSLYFSRNWTEFMAASDNRAKNTYYKKSRLFVDGGSWCAWFDDTDTIGMFTNQGQDRKGYWVEAGDTYEDGQPVFNADTSRLFLLLDAQTETVKNEMTAMMNAMVALSGSTKSLVADKLFDFFDKYYFAEAQEYFPDALYNETTRVVYEASKLTPSYSNDTDPITQALGNYYSGWKRWIKKRIQYMMSKYSFGDYSANGTEFISVRASGAEIKYQITPAIWMYPNIASGTSIVRAGRTKAGETVEMTIDLGGASDQQNTIMGVNYLQSIGRWYNKRIHGAMTVTGRMLRELILGNEDATAEDWAINISSLELKQTPSLQVIDLRNIASLAGTLNLGVVRDAAGNVLSLGCTHLRYLYAQGTALAAITLPKGGGLRYVGYPSTNQRVELRNFPLLTNENIELGACAPNVSAVFVEECPQVSSVALLAGVIEAQKGQETHTLQNVRLTGFNESYSAEEGGADILTKLSKLTDGTYSGLDQDGIPSDDLPKPILQGKLSIDAYAYEDDVINLRNFFGQNLDLSVLGAYLYFADRKVQEVLIANGVSSDGVGITTADVERVTSIGTWFKDNTEITSFDEFEKFTNLTEIPKIAFRNTSNLTSIKIPTTITTIYGGAFYGSGINEFDLKNVSVIGAQYQASGTAFGAFGNCKSLEKVHGGILEQIGEYAFQNCSSLNEIPSLKSVTYIGMVAFMGATLLDVDIDLSSLSELKPRVFEGALIRSVKFGKPITTSGAQASSAFRTAFYNCKNLQRIYGSEYLTVICKNLFYGCTALEIDDLALPNLTSLGQNAFYGVKIKKISDLGKITALPSADTSTQNFGDKSVLEEVVLSEAITTIPNGSFFNYTNCVFEDLNLPNLTSLGGGAFYGTKLRKISSLGNITALPANANNTGGVFANCTELTYVDQSVFDKLTTVATAFANCTNLVIDELRLPSLTDASAGFTGCKIKKVLDLGSITELFGATELLASSQPFGIPSYIEEYVIPSTVTSIGRYAFRGMVNLSHIICNAATPPTLQIYHDLGGTTCPIYVPDSSVDAYKEASDWATYAARIKPKSELNG